MAALTVQTVTLGASGVTLTWNSASASSGDTFANDGRVLMLAKNLSTASCSLTIATPQTIGGASLAVSDLTISVSASTTLAIGPLPTGTFNSGSSVGVTYSNPSTLTIAVLKY